MIKNAELAKLNEENKLLMNKFHQERDIKRHQFSEVRIITVTHNFYTYNLLIGLFTTSGKLNKVIFLSSLLYVEIKACMHGILHSFVVTYLRKL